MIGQVMDNDAVTGSFAGATLVMVVGKHLSSYGIGALEAKLNLRHFLRVHRSGIVLQNVGVVRVSRPYTDGIRELTL